MLGVEDERVAVFSNKEAKNFFCGMRWGSSVSRVIPGSDRPQGRAPHEASRDFWREEEGKPLKKKEKVFYIGQYFLEMENGLIFERNRYLLALNPTTNSHVVQMHKLTAYHLYSNLFSSGDLNSSWSTLNATVPFVCL